jgi:hypothetical protein
LSMNFSSSPCLVAASHRTIQFLFFIFSMVGMDGGGQKRPFLYG